VIVQNEKPCLPFAPKSNGRICSSFSTCCINVSRTHPPSAMSTPVAHIRINALYLDISRASPDTLSKERMLDIPPRLMMTSSLMGTLPPTNPVLPPCGTTPILRSLQYFTISLTCCVVFGRSTTRDVPRYFPIQSLLYEASSDSVTGEAPNVESMAVAGRMRAKCATSSSVTEFKCELTSLSFRRDHRGIALVLAMHRGEASGRRRSMRM
jgi:hypothetical protein